MITAFVLWHVRKDDEYGDDAKLIGVYSTNANAEAAIARLGGEPGFRDHPAGFQIDPYPLDKDHWVDGFISWDEASAPIKSLPATLDGKATGMKGNAR